MKFSSAVPAVVAALGAEVALAAPVIQDVSHLHLTSKKTLTNSYFFHVQDNAGVVAEAADGALIERNADSEEANALADNPGSLTKKVCYLFISSLLPAPGDTAMLNIGSKHSLTIVLIPAF